MFFHDGKPISEGLLAISDGHEPLQMKSGREPLVLQFTVFRLIFMPGYDFVSGGYKTGRIVSFEPLPDGQE